MSTLRLLLCGVIVGALLADPPPSLAQPPVKQPRLDGEGLPLPPGALARLGSARFRHKQPIVFLGFTNEKHLLAQSTDGVLHLWDVAAGKSLRQAAIPKPFDGLVGLRTVLARNGKTLALQVRDEIIIQEAATGKELRRLTRDQLIQQGKINNPKEATLDLSADGQLLWISARSEDGQKNRVTLWKTGTGVLVRALELGDKIERQEIAFADDGSTIATLDYPQEKGEKQKIRLWDVAQGKVVGTFDPAEEEPGSHIQLLPGSKSLLVMSVASSVARLLDVKTGKELRRFSAVGRLHEVLISSDGKQLFGFEYRDGVAHRIIHLWDIDTGKELRQFKYPADRETSLPPAAVSPDGKTLAIAVNTTFRLWDVDSGKDSGNRLGHTDAIGAVAFSPNGNRVVTASLQTPGLLWAATTGKLVQELSFVEDKGGPPISRDPVIQLGRFNLIRAAFTPDGKTVATLMLGQPLRRWEVATGKPLPPWAAQPGFLTSFAYSPNGKLLALSSVGGGVRLIHSTTGKTVREFGKFFDNPKEMNGPPDSLISLVFAADGRTVFVSTTGGGPSGLTATLDGFEVLTGQSRLRILVKQDPQVKQGGPGFDGIMEMLEQLVFALAVAPDGKHLATAGYTTIKVRELPSGREVRLFGGMGLMPATAVFSPDGKLLLAGKADGSICVWDVATGTVRGDLPAHLGAITTLAFSPDGKYLASGSADTTALVWNWAELQQQLATAPTDKKTTPEDLWQALGQAEDGAQKALVALTATPAATVAFLKTKLKPMPPVDPVRLEKLLTDLDSKQFAVRQAATKELEQLGDLAATALDKRLASKMPLEVQRRLEALRDKLDGTPTSGPLLQALRAVEVLERIGTPEARLLLAALAKGAPGHRLTEEAAESVRRLTKIAGGSP